VSKDRKDNMHKTKFQQFGWVLAAAFGAVLLAGGFQGNGDKTGVVDICKVVEGSEFGKQSQATFQQMKTVREEVLTFIDEHRVLTDEQAYQLRDLSLKENATAEERARLETLKAEVVTSGKKFMELAQKQNLSREERDLLEEYARRSQRMEALAQRMLREFTNDIQEWADAEKLASLSRARTAIQEVAKAQGFTVVFEIGIAPYGANDLTADALKAMNARL
jgi:Skp family chaperone for outer membrane proteins